MAADFQVEGKNRKALFTLTVHRGEGMALLAMDWREGKPPDEFVGFAIAYKEPGGDRFFSLKNRLAFPRADGRVTREQQPTTLAPIQKFRWVHFPRNAELSGRFVYRVTPVFMNRDDELSYGDEQEAAIELRRETYPGKLNVTFTRGFVSSQAFVDRVQSQGPIETLLPPRADDGLTFVPTHPDAENALAWMGFEARNAVLEVLDQAIADTSATARVVAYDLSESGVLERLEKLGSRLRVIVDDSGTHGEPHSGESQAARRLAASAGEKNVKRQHMGNLQHNKTIVVEGRKVKAVVCGSTNFSWRGFFVQSNNAIVLRGRPAVERFGEAFEAYWKHDSASAFAKEPAAELVDLGVPGIDVRLASSPHSKDNALLATIANDVETGTTSSLLFSLAFLYQTKGPIRDAVTKAVQNDKIFVYGVSDRKVGGVDVQKPSAKRHMVVRPAALTEDVPEPFRSEPVGGGGNRMHHKFVVIDFDKPTARVYMGSYNFSDPADTKNGENLLVIRDQRIAVAYAVEAIRIFDHYHFRVAHEEAKAKGRPLVLATPPRDAKTKPWWDEYYTDAQKIRDREVFAGR